MCLRCGLGFPGGVIPEHLRSGVRNGAPSTWSGRADLHSAPCAAGLTAAFASSEDDALVVTYPDCGNEGMTRSSHRLVRRFASALRNAVRPRCNAPRDDAVAMVDEVGVVRCHDHGGAGLRALEQQFHHEVSVRCIQ